MDRPSKEAVDRAVEHYHDDSICAIERSCAEILAAEVLALREELEDMRQAAVAFAFIAVRHTPKLADTETLKTLVDESNRLRTSDARELTVTALRGEP